MIPIHKYRKIQLIKSPNYGILILTIKGNNIYSGILTVEMYKLILNLLKSLFCFTFFIELVKKFSQIDLSAMYKH